MNKEIKEKLEKALEVFSWCQENADEKWMVDHLAAVRKDIDQALALLKQPECERCGDTGQVDDPMAGNSHMLTLMECPKCHPHSEQPPAGELLPWQQRLAEEYDRKQFLEMIERYNQKLSGVWDDDFTIKGSELLTIISLGWGAVFRLDSAVAACEIGLHIAEWKSKLSNASTDLAEDIETIKAAITQSKK